MCAAPDRAGGPYPARVKVLLVVNPRSGRGRAAGIAAEFGAALRAAGHAVSVVMLGATARESASAAVVRHCCAAEPASSGSEVAAAVGGDGTVQYLAGLLAPPGSSKATATPPALYHVPTGNENLFARELGMTRSASQLVAALARGDVRPLDMARLSGTCEDGSPWSRPALLMAGFSVDAGVIERLHASRRRASGHLVYLRPALAELLRPTFPRLSVSCGGGVPPAHAGETPAPQIIVRDGRGMLTIANCGRYATRLDPCHAARMDDGLLDAAFMPCASVAGALAWYARAWQRRLHRHPRFVHAAAAEFVIDFPEPTPCQIDGETLGFRVRGRVVARCEPGALRVLVPQRER